MVFLKVEKEVKSASSTFWGFNPQSLNFYLKKKEKFTIHREVELLTLLGHNSYTL